MTVDDYPEGLDLKEYLTLAVQKIARFPSLVAIYSHLGHGHLSICQTQQILPPFLMLLPSQCYSKLPYDGNVEKGASCTGMEIRQNAATSPSASRRLSPPPVQSRSGELGSNKPKPELIKQSAPHIGLSAEIFPMEI